MYFNPKQFEDFIQNESFVRWVHNPADESGAFWREWCLLHPELEKEVALARKLILGVGYANTYDLSADESAALFKKIMYVQKSSHPVNTEDSQLSENRRVFSQTRIRWAMAATVVLVLMTGILVTQKQFFPSNETVAITRNAERKRVVLPDGSVVMLNSGSELTFPAHFTAASREVHFTGEAFFTITKDPKRPFIIHAPGMETTVLGTSFNLKAMPRNRSIAVVTGKVQIEGNHVKKILTPNQVGVLQNNDLVITKNTSKVRKALAWKEGILVFDEAEFDEVFRLLEQWYDVKIIVSPNTVLKGRYSGEFKNESLENVLTGIAFTSHFTFAIDNKQVLISR